MIYTLGIKMLVFIERHIHCVRDITTWRQIVFSTAQKFKIYGGWIVNKLLIKLALKS